MIDSIDSRLMAEVQRNAMLTAQELGDVLNLSASQAARRRQRLEVEGFITGYGARLAPAKVGLTVQAFIQVQMASHAPDADQADDLVAKLKKASHRRLAKLASA